jgi:hypothetical protein
VEIHITNNRRVSWEYEVSKFGPSGVGSVELYMTRDDGMTWTPLHGEHQPLTAAKDSAPGVLRRVLTVTLPEVDGVYGFYLEAKSGAGQSKGRPQKGTTVPQLRVKLDTKPPEARLFKPIPDPGVKDALLLTWKAFDENLAAKPVSIEWAERPTGPWEHIGAAQMANTGSYSWHVPANMPSEVYLRLTVRDLAGNVAVAETDRPQTIDFAVPEVAIRGIVAPRQ